MFFRFKSITNASFRSLRHENKKVMFNDIALSYIMFYHKPTNLFIPSLSLKLIFKTQSFNETFCDYANFCLSKKAKIMPKMGYN